jgi:hypothetical protein
MKPYASHKTLHKTDIEIFPKTQSYQHDENLIRNLHSKHKIQPELSNSFLCCIFLAVHFPSRYLLHLSAFYLTISLTLPARRTVTAWLSREQQTFQTHSSSSYFLLSFLDLRQPSRYLTSSFMQKFKPLDSLKLSRTAKNIVLPYLQLLPAHFTNSFPLPWTYFHQLILYRRTSQEFLVPMQ